MADIGERVKKLRLSLELTQKQFAAKCGISVRAVSDIEKGEQGLQSKTFQKIVKAFNIDPAWLLTGEERVRKLPVIVADSKTEYDAVTKLKPIPVVNEVPAGYPEIPLLDDYISGYVYLPHKPGHVFGLYVSGKSMEPEIYDGDIVIVDISIKELKKRDLGIFRINNETTIKRYVPAENGYILQPENPKFKPIIITEDTECVVIGKVIYKIVKY